MAKRKQRPSESVEWVLNFSPAAAERVDDAIRDIIAKGLARTEAEAIVWMAKRDMERKAIAQEAGRKGGTARAERHTPEEISEMARQARQKMPKAERKRIAQIAAKARWSLAKPKEKGKEK